MTNSIALGLVNIGIALLTFAISLPLVLGKIGMNAWYGVRIPKSFVSEDNWYKINRHGGLWLIVYAFLLALIGLLSVATPELKVGTLWFWIVILAPLHQLPIPLFAIFKFAKTLPDKDR